MRKIAANYIFPVNGRPIKHGIVCLNDKGIITEIIDNKGEIKETAGVEFYNGVIVPGFVNTHCHLELSHLKNQTIPHSGMMGFIAQIKQQHLLPSPKFATQTANGDREMQKNGIVAVGDISNTAESFQVKEQSSIYYHTFIELFSTESAEADSLITQAQKLAEKIGNTGNYSVVPHAPYSLSDKLFRLIMLESKRLKRPITMHNQETKSENQLFRNKTGSLYEGLSRRGVDYSEFLPTGQNSLPSVAHYFPDDLNILLVHNTFTTETDIDAIQNVVPTENLYWTFCVNANLYIENSVPDIPLFIRKKQNITIGTDSLASNHSLSILDEMKIIAKNFQDISFDEMLPWATINGAKALEIEKKYGSLETGKTPGIVLIEHFDFRNMHITPESRIKVLI